MEDILAVEERKKEFKKIKTFLNMLNFVPTSQNFINAVKEISVAKLCEVIGIRCKYNYESSFFNFFANVTGQAICEILQIPITIADAKYRLVRYNRVNLVEQTIKLLQEFELEESFIEIFNFLDNYKDIVQ